MIENSKRNAAFWLFWLFITSVLIRFYLAFRTGGINDFPDEPYYWSVSKCLFLHEPLSFRALPVGEKDILYPLVVSVAHIFKDFKPVYRVMLLINTVLMSSAVFPVYLLSYKILNNRKYALLVAFVSALLPEMFYSSKIITENLYYPYMMWIFYLFYAYLLQDKYSIKRAAVFSLFASVSIYIRLSSGLCLVAALSIYYGLQFFFIKNRKQLVRNFILMLIPVVIWGLNESLIALVWPQAKYTSSFATLFYYYDKLLDVGRFLLPAVIFFVLFVLLLWAGKRYAVRKNAMEQYEYIVRGIKYVLSVLIAAGILIAAYRIIYIRVLATYIVYMCIFFGLFPPVLSVAYADSLPDREKDFFIFSALLWLIMTVATVYLVFRPDLEIRQPVVRLHYRFICYFCVPFLVMFLRMFDTVARKGLRYGYVVVSITVAGMTVLSMSAEAWSIIDAPSVAFLESAFDWQSGQKKLIALVIFLLLFGCFMIWRRRIREWYIFAFVLLTVFFCCSNVKIYKKNIAENQTRGWEVAVRDGERLADFFERQEEINSSEDVLIASSVIANFGALDLCLHVPYRVCLWGSLLSPEVWNGENIAFGNLDFCQSDAHFYRLEWYTAPRYIISEGPIPFPGYNIEEIGLENYYLYVRADNGI